MIGLLRRIKRAVLGAPAPELPVDFTPEERELWSKVSPYTMTSPERLQALVAAVEYVSRARVPGDIVECGVWKGGSSMAAALTLKRLGDVERTLHLFDTFEGMSAPTDEDVDLDGAKAAELLAKSSRDELIWCDAPLEAVKKALASTAYPPDRVRFIKGKVEDTIPEQAPKSISILRLDTDWYESTRHELEHLYPRLSLGGVLIIDDYGHWQGARRAVDEYFKNRPILLQRIDYTGRMALKNS